MGPSVATRQDHPPRTSQMLTLSQKARKTGRLGGGPNTLKPENNLPLAHPQANWDLLGSRREERARSSQAATLTVIRRQRRVLPLQVEPSPNLAFSLPSERGLLPRCRQGLCAAELTFLWEAVQQSDKPPHTCRTSSLPRPQAPQGLTRLKACLLLPSWSLKQPACVLREGRAGVEHQRKQGRRQEQCPAALADQVATSPGAAGPGVT